MALIKSCRNKTPKMGEDCFISETATIIGDMVCGNECSFWFNSVVRGDVHYIKLGNKVNVQDGAIVHCTYERFPVNIGDNVSIGHRAIVHGCTIHDDVLIGMGAIVMDNVVVHSGSIIAAGAVVLENTIVEAHSIYAGVPAKKVKSVNSELAAGQIKRIANSYVKYASWYRE